MQVRMDIDQKGGRGKPRSNHSNELIEKGGDLALEFPFTSFLSKALSIPTLNFDKSINFYHKIEYVLHLIYTK